jgi:hypothetical protein
MRRRIAELQVEGLLGRDRLLRAHHGDGAIGEPVVGEVVFLFGRIEKSGAVEQLGGPEVVGRVPLEPVGAVEPATRRPVVVRAVRPVRRGEVDVPLADVKRRPARVAQDFGERRRLERHVAAVSRVAAVDVGEPSHARRVMVEPGHERRARRRAHCAGAEVRVAEPAGGERVERRRADLAAVAAEVGEPDVVHHDDDDVGRARGCRDLAVYAGRES